MGPSSARILGPLLSLADSALRCPRSPPPRTAPRKLPAPRGRQPRPALPVRWTRMCARWGDALLVRSRNQPPPTPKLGLRRLAMAVCRRCASFLVRRGLGISPRMETDSDESAMNFVSKGFLLNGLRHEAGNKYGLAP